MGDKRQFIRIHFEAETTLTVAGAAHPVWLRDISLKGALVELAKDAGVDQGAACHLEIALEGSPIVLQVEACAAHVEGRNLGLRFESFDLDTFTHLRALLEANTGDTELIDRELSLLTRS